MKYKFQVDKKNYDIEIANTVTFHSETVIKVNRKPMVLQLGETHKDEVRSLFLNNKLVQIEVVKDQEGYPSGIFVDDEYYPASLVKIDKLFYYKPKPLKSSQSGVVKSFIPGNIKRVFYKVNDRVKEGDIILIHEAMKMENEIRAPRSGRIKSLGVEEGDNILAHHLLFEID